MTNPMDAATSLAAALQANGTACPKCGGYGKGWDAVDHEATLCSPCNGTGQVRELPSLAPLTSVQQVIASQAAYVERVKIMPEADRSCEYHDRMRFDATADDYVCLMCEQAALDGMRDAAPSYVPKPPTCNDEHCEHFTEDAEDPCALCEDQPMCESGNRDCWPDDGHYCPDCMGTLTDRAMDMMDTER